MQPLPTLNAFELIASQSLIPTAIEDENAPKPLASVLINGHEPQMHVPLAEQLGQSLTEEATCCIEYKIYRGCTLSKDASLLKLPLYSPPDAKTKAENGQFEGKLRVGVFPIITNEQGNLLVIKKRPEAGGFWYVPGGLVDRDDPSLEATGAREVLEETGLSDLQLGDFKFAYQSISRFRNNLMLFVRGSSQDQALNNFKANDEIEACLWVHPNEFKQGIESGKFESLPSINYVLKSL